ncbi:MAG: TRAP transporter small permease [Betaproteobacteria bacterium]|nr:MAG: TRAP transporter small permease [Betaproteobacteria bacterium]
MRVALETLSARLNWVAEQLLAILIAVTVVAVTAQVIFRYGIESSLTWSEEVARYSFIWSIFIGTSVAARRNQHIVVDIFVKAMPSYLQRWLGVANLAVCIAFFSLFVYVSILLVQNAIPQKSSSLEISIAWVYLSAVLGGGLTVLHIVNALFPPLQGKRT